MDLGVKLAGLELANPILLASGTCGYGQELSELLDLDGLGGIVTKAVTREPRRGNPTPRVTETPAGMLNAIGLANVGVEAFVADKLPWLAARDCKVIVNVAGRTVEDYVAVIERLEDASGVDGYELNVSCPNVAEGGLAFGVEARQLAAVTSAARRAASRPLVVKLSPNVTDIVACARAAVEAGAEALSLINTLIGMAVDVERRRPVLANVTGGLSGPAIKPVGLAMVHKVFAAVDVPVIGIGGIASVTDVVEYLMCGASAVQLGTATFVDPALAGRIASGLSAWLAAHDEHDPRALIGACHPRKDTQ